MGARGRRRGKVAGMKRTCFARKRPGAESVSRRIADIRAQFGVVFQPLVGGAIKDHARRIRISTIRELERTHGVLVNRKGMMLGLDQRQGLFRSRPHDAGQAPHRVVQQQTLDCHGPARGQSPSPQHLVVSPPDRVTPSCCGALSDGKQVIRCGQSDHRSAGDLPSCRFSSTVRPAMHAAVFRGQRQTVWRRPSWLASLCKRLVVRGQTRLAQFRVANSGRWPAGSMFLPAAVAAKTRPEFRTRGR